MQLSYDSKGNSVPTILLLMQGHLYAQGGLREQSQLMSMDHVRGVNVANLADMEQSRMLANTLAQNNDPKFHVCKLCYCMGRKVKHEVPEDWVCESGKRDEAVTIAMSKGQLSISQLHSKKKKPVEIGKVKFIPHEEILKLSSETFNESRGQKLNIAHYFISNAY
ncbi:uncharacterized protein LOC133824652 isoform X2 [Humulus lupulus]|uniref:uncharacterized protein LOC133824652 isoform X2 n=1 Tax=Humulus lupulus TaxID=3486 RepID=UPI002B412BE6|nr:uncharacterized protein LOC133824652 isoform X2 [Humulus lupulus]